MTTKTAFSRFYLRFEGELITFKTYRELKSFRITHKPFILRPLQRLADYIEATRERKLEHRFNLPADYLSGLFHTAMQYNMAKRLAYQVAQEYYHSYTEQQVWAAINRWVPTRVNQAIQDELNRLSLINHSTDNEYCEMKLQSGSVATYQSFDLGEDDIVTLPETFQETAELHPQTRGFLK